MTYNPEMHHRRSIRLRGYDYSQAGAYFITICTERRLCLFGEVQDGVILSNRAGQLITEQWEALPRRFPSVVLDEYIVMPNHLHGILVIEEGSGQPQGGQPQGGQPQGLPVRAALGDVVGAFKSLTTNAYINGVQTQGWTPFPKRLWQRNYWEHIIRSERALDAIREYIVMNPANWPEDNENPGQQTPRRGNPRGCPICHRPTCNCINECGVGP